MIASTPVTMSKRIFVLCAIMALLLAGCIEEDTDDKPITGCTDSTALNWDGNATKNDISCEYETQGENDTTLTEPDTDGDGIPDDEDQCPGEDDNIDDDGSGEPDCTESSN